MPQAQKEVGFHIGNSVRVEKPGNVFHGMVGKVIGHTSNPAYDTRVQFVCGNRIDTDIFHHCHLR